MKNKKKVFVLNREIFTTFSHILGHYSSLDMGEEGGVTEKDGGQRSGPHTCGT